MASDENSFFGLKVPEGNDRRELYKSQYRAIYTCAQRATALPSTAVPRYAAAPASPTRQRSSGVSLACWHYCNPPSARSPSCPALALRAPGS